MLATPESLDCNDESCAPAVAISLSDLFVLILIVFYPSSKGFGFVGYSIVCSDTIDVLSCFPEFFKVLCMGLFLSSLITVELSIESTVLNFQ